MLSRSRRGLLTLLMCGSALLLSACGTGFSAQTNQIYTGGIGTNHRQGDIEVLNALFVDNGDGTATLSAGILDNSETGDKVSNVDATSAGDTVTIKLQRPIELPSGDLVHVGAEPSVVLPDGGFENGYLVQLRLTFENAAPITVKVPVVERTSMYDSVATTPAKSPPKKPSASQTDSATATN